MSEALRVSERIVAALPGRGNLPCDAVALPGSRPCDAALDGRLSAPRDDGLEGGFESTAGTGEEGGGLASIELRQNEGKVVTPGASMVHEAGHVRASAARR